MKSLFFFLAHIDDFEISCLSYLNKHKEEYNKIYCCIASDWDQKREIWKENLKKIEEFFDVEIDYINLGFPQRNLTTNFDEVKDSFYKILNFDKNSRFDIVTHDFEDCHTDHKSIHLISKGLYKYTNRFITIYSPSSSNFKANYWIGLNEDQHNFKKILLDKYDINVEQSYTKLGYYLKSDNHYDLGRSHYLENFVHDDYPHSECFNILKWS